MNNNDIYDQLMGRVDWADSETDSGYFDSDNEAGNPGSSWFLTALIFNLL